MNDTAVTAASSGIVGGIAHNIVTWPFYLLGITTKTYIHMNAALFLGKPRPEGVELLVGVLVDLGLVSILGLILTLIFIFTGKDYWLFKGLGYGILVWLIVQGLVNPMIMPAGVIPTDMNTVLVFLLGHLVGATSASYFIVHYRKLPVIFSVAQTKHVEDIDSTFVSAKKTIYKLLPKSDKKVGREIKKTRLIKPKKLK